jgi:hypothetical protein
MRIHLDNLERVLKINCSINNLAFVLRSQGKYEEAEKMHWQILELKEGLLSRKHPDTRTDMNKNRTA